MRELGMLRVFWGELIRELAIKQAVRSLDFEEGDELKTRFAVLQNCCLDI